MMRICVITACLLLNSGSPASEYREPRVSNVPSDWSTYTAFQLAYGLFARRNPPDPLSPYNQSPTAATIAAVKEELRRRPGLTEFMLSKIESGTADHDVSCSFYAALGLALETTPEQKRRIMRLIRASWAEYQEVAAGRAESTRKGYGLPGAAEFLGANPSPESEELLIAMLPEHTDYYVPAVLAESGSAAALPHLKSRLAEIKASRSSAYSPYTAKFEGWIKQLEDRIRSGAAQVSVPVSPTGDHKLVTSVGSLHREDSARSFWHEPFVWMAVALLVAALVALFCRRQRIFKRL